MQDPRNRHRGTIAQVCWAMSWQLRHVLTIGKNLLNSNISPTSSQYGELRPTSGWDLWASLRHPCKFQRVSRLGSVTAHYSSSGRQPNFAALNRGHHLYSTGRPSRWALAHISSLNYRAPFCIKISSLTNEHTHTHTHTILRPFLRDQIRLWYSRICAEKGR